MFTEFVERQWNHEKDGLCRLVEKTLHINASFLMSKVISCLKCIIWLNRSLVLSYIVNFNIRNPLGGS